ncbi:universal stress protein [Halorubellus sp. JP-L1]|uniref:universal stress protein n=1 Tax=Halorubellus sp. JP-L1 TaxID=2715753 RepID=UPI00140C767B|nr:universal stress protein [Halorubellus sp. JP-L1]NHN42105.1 universal stress protein [Halorubellus sp. JP-L1]
MTLSTLLVAVGPSDADRVDSLSTAVTEVAEPTGANVVLLHVFADESFADVRDQLDRSDASPTAAARRQKTVRELTAAFDDADVSYEVQGRVGEKSDAIVAVAEDVDADRVFVAGRARSPAGKAVFGSTAQSVMLTAPCPVTFVRDGSR